MDDETSSDLQKCLSESHMDTDEGPLINENSNGLSHLLTDGEFNSVDSVAVDESSASNQAFLNAVELSADSVGDYLENNADSFNTDSFDVGDITFPSDSLNNVLSDCDSRMSDSLKPTSDSDIDFAETRVTKMEDTSDVLPTEISYQVESADVIDNEVEKPDSKEPIEENSDQEKEVIENMQENIEEMEENNEQEQELKENIEREQVNDSEENIDNPDNNELNPEKDHDEVSNTQKHENVIQANDDTNDIQNPSDQIQSSVDTPQDKDKKPESETIQVSLENIKIEVTEEDKLENKENTADENSKMNECVPLEISPEKIKVEESEDQLKNIKIEPSEVTEDENAKENEGKKLPVKSEIVTDMKMEVGGAEETEVVSEDELPVVQKPSVKDAENVSDDELPGPKPAELPADTEVVSEDELPASKKDIKESRKRKPNEAGDGYDPGSPTSESESSNKKLAISKNGESKPIPAEKRVSIDEKPKKKVLPELDKYWKVVNDDPTDFTGWTYLLQYVDQESDVEAAREAYDAFLSHYPYCYGYWRKYADYEKRKGSKKKCLEVLERGLKAIPLSVDLWIHYLNHIKATRTEDHIFIRSQYERAIDACGLEFRSDRLWESYIKWEAENGSALNVTNIYDRLLATPTLGYTSHFDNFQEHVMSEPATGVVSSEELVRLRADVRAAATTPAPPPSDLPPGEDEPADHIASEEEGNAVKERIIAARRKIHKSTGEEVAARWTFEEGIKRPYFHVKPLERCQLKNWKTYLEWEKQHGSLKRILVLHERCLIACALYEEFWMRLIKFLEERLETNPELITVEREVLERACSIHHLDKPELHLHWAHFEEAQGNTTKAAEILDRIEKSCPNLVQVQYRRVNLERRRGDFEKCIQLYESYIASAKNKTISSAMAIKYARFLFYAKQDPAAARKALDDAIVKDPLNPRLHLQRLDLAIHTPGATYEQMEELAGSYERQEGAELETSATMAWRRRELADELGGAGAARTAHAHARTLHKHLRKRARKDKHEPPPPPISTTEVAKKKENSTATSNAPAASSGGSGGGGSGSGGGGGGGGGYYQAPPTNTQSYDQSYAQPYQPAWPYQQPGAPYQHHPHWPQYPNYY